LDNSIGYALPLYNSSILAVLVYHFSPLWIHFAGSFLVGWRRSVDLGSGVPWYPSVLALVPDFPEELQQRPVRMIASLRLWLVYPSAVPSGHLPEYPDFLT